MTRTLLLLLSIGGVLLVHGDGNGCQQDEIFKFMIGYGWETPDPVFDLVLNNYPALPLPPFPFNIPDPITGLIPLQGQVENEERRNTFFHRKDGYDFWRLRYGISFDENIEGIQFSSNYPDLYVFPIAINLNYEYKVFSYSDPERLLVPDLDEDSRFSVPVTNAFIDDIAWFVFKSPLAANDIVIHDSFNNVDEVIDDTHILVYGSYRLFINGQNVTNNETDIYYFSAEVFNFLAGGGIDCMLRQRDLGTGRAFGFGGPTGTGKATTKLFMTFPQSFQDLTNRDGNYTCNNLKFQDDSSSSSSSDD